MRLGGLLELPQRMFFALVQVDFVEVGMAHLTIYFLPVVVVTVRGLFPEGLPHHPFPEAAQVRKLQRTRTRTGRNQRISLYVLIPVTDPAAPHDHLVVGDVASVYR